MLSEGFRPVDIKEQLGRSAVSELYIHPIKSAAGSQVATAEVTPTGFKHDRELMIMFPNGRFMSQRDKKGERLALVHPSFINDDLLRVEASGMPELYVPLIREGDTMDATIHKTTGIKVVSQGTDAKKWFGEFLGTDCDLVTMAEGYTRQTSQRWAPRETDQVSLADGYPFLMISQESLNDLNRRLPEALPMNRFRPNIVIRGSGIPYGEDRMRKIQIGEIGADIVKPCIRCPITMKDQIQGGYVEGDMKHEPLATLSRYRYTKLKTGDAGPIFGQNLVHANTGRIQVGDKLRIVTTGKPPTLIPRAA